MEKDETAPAARDFMLEGARIIIRDDFCRSKSPDEAADILARAARRAAERLVSGH